MCNSHRAKPIRVEAVAGPRLRVVRRSELHYNSAATRLTTKDPRVGERPTDGFRIGIGHDTHRLTDGGPLILGGVEIPYHRHALGHSDADVLLHAITDALLGAASLGDIGELFPDTAAENKGRDSGEMLQLAYSKVRESGYMIVNLDSIVFAQRPKLSPYKAQIRERVATLLQIPANRVGIKAKTGEGVDAVGREEAVMAQCVALLSIDPT